MLLDAKSYHVLLLSLYFIATLVWLLHLSLGNGIIFVNLYVTHFAMLLIKGMHLVLFCILLNLFVKLN